LPGESAGTGYGVSAGIGQNCYGFGGSGNGIDAQRTAIGCFGESTTGPAGVNTVNAV
jgi:hypothetical protein